MAYVEVNAPSLNRRHAAFFRITLCMRLCVDQESATPSDCVQGRVQLGNVCAQGRRGRGLNSAIALCLLGQKQT